MEKEIKELNKEEATKLLQEDIKNGIGDIRNYVFNEKGNFVDTKINLSQEYSKRNYKDDRT